MKRNYIISLFLCLLLCLAATNTALGETRDSAKQLFLTDLKNNFIVITAQPYQIYSGTSAYELKKLETNEPDFQEITNLLKDAKLKFDSKIDTPAKKTETKYTITLGRQKATGSLFMDSNKLIISTELIDLLRTFEWMSIPADLTPPRYFYFTNAADDWVWDSMVQAEISPALQEMLIFIFEAVPEHYFMLSPDGKKVILHIDRDGLPEVVRALALKLLDEQERFADLVVNIGTSINPEISMEMDKQAILEALKEFQEVVDTQDSPDKMLEKLGDKLSFDLIIESSLLPAGPGKCLINIGINDLSTSSNIKMESTSQGSKENLSGSIFYSLFVSDEAEAFSARGSIREDYHLTTDEYSTDSKIDVSIKGVDEDEENRYLNLSLQGKERYKPQKSVTIKLPELTPVNSIDLSDMLYQPDQYHENLQIVLDGKALSFDVDPFIKDGRTMVPLRSMAEILGFTVTWSEPNQVIMNKEDTNISMFLGEQLYTVNGAQKYMDVTPFEINGRTMAPVRFIAEGTGCMVYYSEASNTVYINHKPSTHITHQNNEL